jgi:thiazole/oxazole-forming peptide maturase SagD family component
MRAEHDALHWVLAETWKVTRTGQGIVFDSWLSDKQIVLGIRTHTKQRAFLAAITRPHDAVRLHRQLDEVLGDREGNRLVHLLRRERVLRQHGEPSKAMVCPGLDAALAIVLASNDWKVPQLSAIDLRRPEQVTSRERRGVIATASRRMFAFQPNDEACAHCFALRANARKRDDLDLKGRAHRSDSLQLRRALFVELLTQISERPLLPGEALVVGAGSEVQRGMCLPHPDCRLTLQRANRHLASVSSFRRALGEAKDRSVDNDELRRLLLASPVAPAELFEVPSQHGKYPLDLPFVWGHVYLTRQVDGELHDASNYGVLYGSSLDHETAARLAMSEAVERLCTRGASPQAYRRIPKKSSRNGLLRGSQRVNAGGQRKPFFPGIDLVTNRTVLVAFEDIGLKLSNKPWCSARLRETSFSGAASHVTAVAAVIHATLELIQRDAFMISWYRKRALSCISWPTSPTQLAAARAKYLTRRGMTLELFDLRLAFPCPTVLLRITAKKTVGNWPRGGSLLIPSAGFGAHQALEHALGIACAQFIVLGVHPSPEKDPLDPRRVRSLARRVPYWPLLARYLNPRFASAHSFLGGDTLEFESLPDYTPEDSKEALKLLVRWFRKQRLSLHAVRLTDSVAHRLGLEVVKVVVPGFVSLVPRRADVNWKSPRMWQNWPLATLSGAYSEPHPLY